MFSTLTYQKINQDFKILISPFKNQTSNIEKGIAKINSVGTVYSDKICNLEGFLRILWGLNYFYIQNDYDDFFYSILKGIEEGTDPKSEHYWGKIEDYDQKMVEIPPLALFLIEHQTVIFEHYEKDTLTNVFDYLNQINDHLLHRNNWVFFRIITNMALDLVFEHDNRVQIEKDFKVIESFYIGNGWYVDGRYSQRDYYIAFAFHYYSLLYSKYYEKKDNFRSELFKERACKFAYSYETFFDLNGRALPFGRSLIYRFAQSCFWSVMIWADIDGYPLENAKYFLENNFKYWFKQDIFDNAGYLNLGYTYPNHQMLEEYNGGGSPYWSFKSFLILSLPENHSIWTTKPIYPNRVVGKRVNRDAGMFIYNNKKSIQAFPIDQSVYHHVNGKAKYERFVYSTNFGFNIPKGAWELDELTFDNTLALSEEDSYYRSPDHTEVCEISNEYMIKKWNPWKDVTVSTIIVPMFPWHIRFHSIQSQRKLKYIDSGFSVPEFSDGKILLSQSDTTILLKTKVGSSGIKTLDLNGQVLVSPILPNTNILYNRVLTPYVEGKIDKGLSYICNIFYGNDSHHAEDFDTPPVVEICESYIIIKNKDQQEKISIKYCH